MSDTSPKVLFIEDNPGDVRLVHELLSQEYDGKVVLVDAADLATGAEYLKSDNFDTILLDPNLPDADSPESIKTLRDVAPNCPIVVLTGEKDEAVISTAFQSGAEDYLVKGTINGEILGRALRYSMERRGLWRALEEARLDAQREREWRAMERLANPPPVHTTAASYGEQSLETASPDLWDLVVVEYASLIESSIEERTFRGGSDHHSRVQNAAQRLGGLRAEPRDVVKIHVEAIKRAAANSNIRTRHAIAEEARLLLIEIMGHLASYYRAFMGPKPYPSRSSDTKQDAPES